MSIDSIKQLFEFISNKYQSGSISGAEFNLIANEAQRDFQNYLIGQVEQYQYGRPIGKVGLGMTEEIQAKLSPFKKTPVTVVTLASGQAAKPADLRREIALRTTDDKKIRRIEDDRFDAAFNSTIDSVATNPFYVEYNAYYQVYPTATTTVKLEYYIKPPDAVWGFTIVSAREVYNAGSSTSWLWRDSETTELVGRMLKIFGIPLKETELIQYSQSVALNGE